MCANRIQLIKFRETHTQQTIVVVKSILIAFRDVWNYTSSHLNEKLFQGNIRQYAGIALPLIQT